METKEKHGRAQTFAIWFGLAALMFGTQMGGSMAAGTYAVGYFAPYGGGWLLVFIAIYFCFRSVFAIHALEFTRLFKTDNYSAYYLELYGLNSDTANPMLKKLVMWMFDIYTTVGGIIVVAATINLFGSLTESIGINAYMGRLIAVVMFAFLSIYGAAFLRKFNTAMTVSLVVSMLVILAAVLSVRGNVFFERMGNFSIGADWTGKPVSSQIMLLISFGFASLTIGSTLCNFSEKIRSTRDSVGSGLLIGLLSISAFFLTSCIVMPFLPEMINNTPILSICQTYLPSVITMLYWIIVVFSVVSTGPTYSYTTANRFAKIWKTQKISRQMKLFIISLIFLIGCYIISGVGLLVIVKKGFSALGSIASVIIGIPMLISLPRMAKKKREEMKQA